MGEAGGAPWGRPWVGRPRPWGQVESGESVTQEAGCPTTAQKWE